MRALRGNINNDDNNIGTYISRTSVNEMKAKKKKN